MIRWLNPAALAGLALVAAPIVIHLLRTHRAERVAFPSLRFVRAAQTSAVRLRWPSDFVLLMLRIGVISAAVLASARPIVLTSSRLERWNARVARAIVVDTSDSMGRARAAAAEAADAEKSGAAFVVRLDDQDLTLGLERATAWLRAAPPARRELVVISDFQRGSLTSGDVASVPESVGLRFVHVGEPERAKTIRGLDLFSADGVPPRHQDIEITSAATRLTIAPSRDAGSQRQPGLRIVGGEPVERVVVPALRAVARAGAPAPSGEQPLAVMFSDSAVVPPVTAIGQRWMLQTILRVREDASLTSAARQASAVRFTGSEAWTTISVDKDGHALVSAAESGGELLVHVAAPAGSFFAAAALSALLNARGEVNHAEQEIAGIDASDLAAWSRVSAPVQRDEWRHVEDSDARWFWLAALLLLALEPLVRRPVARAEEVRIAA